MQKSALIVPIISKTQNGRMSMIDIQQAYDAMPQYAYSDNMTLKEYLEAKNVQRRLEDRALNYQRGGDCSPMKEQKEYIFEKQVHDIKGFVKHIVGQGSLFNKFTTMLDNLYIMFLKEITVYHKLKVDREKKGDDLRLKEFREANNKLSAYLKSCEDESDKIQERLEHMRKTKEFYKKERQEQLAIRRKKQEEERKILLKKQTQRIEAELKQKRIEQLGKGKCDDQQADNSIESNQLNISVNNKKGENKTRLEVKKTVKEMEDYKKRKDHIGKLSNVFASFIGGGP